MASSPGTPTLDQLHVFLTVVDAGSFAGAARKLGRATSVVSYSIANLEAQLGVALFDRVSTRKPPLTDAGRTVLSELHLVLDVMLPAWRVVDALKALRAEFPSVSLRLYHEALGAVPQMVLERGATIGVCGPLDVEIAGLERIGVGSVELIPVAAPDHALVRAGKNPPGAGRDHIQLVLTDRSSLCDGQDRGVIGAQTWRLGDLGARHMLLRKGIGWGYMPEPMVRDDIERGRLVRLDMPEYKDGFLRLHAIYRTDTPPGPAGAWLIDRFVAQASDRSRTAEAARALGQSSGQSSGQIIAARQASRSGRRAEG